MNRFDCFLATVASTLLAPGLAHAGDPDPLPSSTDTDAQEARPTTTRSFEHAQGFALDARWSLGGPLAGTTVVAPVTIGYRGARFAVLAGPALRVTVDCGIGCVDRYGAQLTADVTAFRGADGRLDGYIPFGGHAFEGGGWGARAGFGVRYWFARHAAVFAELGLAYRQEKELVGSEKAFGTVSSLGLALAF